MKAFSFIIKIFYLPDLGRHKSGEKTENTLLPTDIAVSLFLINVTGLYGQEPVNCSCHYDSEILITIIHPEGLHKVILNVFIK